MFLLASILAVLGASDPGQAAEAAPAVFTGPVSDPTYAEDVRCTGVLYSYQHRLRQNDPRQISIRNALEVLNERLEDRVSTGEIEEAVVAASLQEAVNAATTASTEVMEGCLKTPPS